MIDEGNPEAVRQVLAKPVHDPEAGIYVQELTSEVTWAGEKESKYFSCPRSADVNNFGHRKQENIGGQQQRMIVEWVFFATPVSVSPTLLEYHFDTQLDIENRKLIGIQWIGTQPPFEMGTLLNGSGTGLVSSTNPERAMRVYRRISQYDLSNNLIDIFNDAGPPTAGPGFRVNLTQGVSDAILIIDNAEFPLPFTNRPIVSNYILEEGRVSVNWTDRSTTMDIQLGCQ